MNSGECGILESWCYTRESGAASILNGEPSDSRKDNGKEGNPRVLVLYQEEWGSVDPQRRAVRFQGIPGGVARGSIPGRMAASGPTPVGSKQKWCYLRSFVYTRVAWWTAYTRSNQDSVYTRSLQDSVHTRWCSFTHTSVRGAASAWAADTCLSSDCDGVCVAAFTKRVSWVMTLVGADWYHQSPRL